MNLENVPEQYLLVMHCDKQGYWDTSGYCHWSKPALHRKSTFNLDDEEGLIKAIGCFKEEYPNGDYEIYVIKNFDWYDHKEQREYLRQLGDKGEDLAKVISKERRIKEEEKQRNDLLITKEYEKQKELDQLRKLKEKYES
jgi:hypothetical protein